MLNNFSGKIHCLINIQKRNNLMKNLNMFDVGFSENDRTVLAW